MFVARITQFHNACVDSLHLHQTMYFGDFVDYIHKERMEYSKKLLIFYFNRMGKDLIHLKYPPDEVDKLFNLSNKDIFFYKILGFVRTTIVKEDYVSIHDIENIVSLRYVFLKYMEHANKNSYIPNMRGLINFSQHQLEFFIIKREYTVFDKCAKKNLKETLIRLEKDVTNKLLDENLKGHKYLGYDFYKDFHLYLNHYIKS